MQRATAFRRALGLGSRGSGIGAESTWADSPRFEDLWRDGCGLGLFGLGFWAVFGRTQLGNRRPGCKRAQLEGLGMLAMFGACLGPRILGLLAPIPGTLNPKPCCNRTRGLGYVVVLFRRLQKSSCKRYVERFW